MKPETGIIANANNRAKSQISDSGDKENRNNMDRKSSTTNESTKEDAALGSSCEKRPVRRSRRKPASIGDAPPSDHSEDDLVREASALLQRCELSDDEQSRKRAVSSRKLMEAIVTIRKSVAPRRRRKGK